MLFLKKEDIIKSFSMREAIDADKKALSLYSAGKASVLFAPISMCQKATDKAYICQLM